MCVCTGKIDWAACTITVWGCYWQRNDMRSAPACKTAGPFSAHAPASATLQEHVAKRLDNRSILGGTNSHKHKELNPQPKTCQHYTLILHPAHTSPVHQAKHADEIDRVRRARSTPRAVSMSATALSKRCLLACAAPLATQASTLRLSSSRACLSCMQSRALEPGCICPHEQ